jgi:serine/threonine protein phosphatase PrpC
MKFSLAQDSRVGARPYNQDRIGFWKSSEALLAVVADGMGGHLNGELAAQIAVDFFGDLFGREARPRLADPDLFLFRGIGRAHTEIIERSRAMGLPESPRTVIVACVVQGGYAWWSHIGDSRFYLLRNGRIVTRTRDHTRVQYLIDSGRIREEAAAAHPERNLLLQCLGSERPPVLEPAQTARLAKDDVLLLCSDGLWGPLTPRQLTTAFTSRPLDQAIAELATLAEKRAGPQCDNVSALALVWGEEEVSAAGAPYTVPFHELPTDVQDFTATDPDFLRLSDSEIERAIDEIKSALKKNPPRDR